MIRLIIYFVTLAKRQGRLRAREARDGMLTEQLAAFERDAALAELHTL